MRYFMSLYDKLVKLAYENKSLRKDLLPVIKQANPAGYFSSKTAKGSWNVDVSRTPLDRARQYAEQRLARAGKDLYELWPDFDENYTMLRRKLSQALDIPRIQMPVIEPEDMAKFHEKLNQGKIDIFAPWAKGEFFAPSSFASKDEADEWVELGWQDGDPTGDVINAKWSSVAAGKLKPTQSQIWFDKVVEGLVEFGPIRSGSPVLDLTIIVSKEGYILDGHHRFAGTVLANPSLRLSALYIPLDIDTLLAIGRAYGASQGNKPKA